MYRTDGSCGESWPGRRVDRQREHEEPGDVIAAADSGCWWSYRRVRAGTWCPGVATRLAAALLVMLELGAGTLAGVVQVPRSARVAVLGPAASIRPGRANAVARSRITAGISPVLPTSSLHAACGAPTRQGRIVEITVVDAPPQRGWLRVSRGPRRGARERGPRCCPSPGPRGPRAGTASGRSRRQMRRRRTTRRRSRPRRRWSG